jgi:hypothetical protein
MAAEHRLSLLGEHRVEAQSLAAYASREYLLELGWRTTVRDGEVLLELDDDMAAVVLPADWAMTALADLRAMNLCCPVVLLPDGVVPHCVFLLEEAKPHGELPPPWLWRPWPAGEGVPLPIGHSLSAHTWLRPPTAGGAVSVAVLAGVLARLLDGRAGNSESRQLTA